MLPKLVTFYLICSYYIIYLYLASSALVVREVDQIWIFFKLFDFYIILKPLMREFQNGLIFKIIWPSGCKGIWILVLQKTKKGFNWNVTNEKIFDGFL